LELPPNGIGPRQEIEIPVNPKHLHDREVGTHGHARASALKAAQRHRRHPGTLSHLLCRKAPSQACKTQAVTEPLKPFVDRREKWRSLLSHSGDILP
jgi:hypothetical protein